MSFPVPETWSRDTAEFKRDNEKRTRSPCSFFFTQGKALVLAADYFNDSRLTDSAKGGVAGKHRHRIQLSLFGQLMAAFEYMLKDYIAQVIDSSNVIDDRIMNQEWVSIGVDSILSQKSSETSIGSMLIHPTLGWHYPSAVNSRFKALFDNTIIEESEVPTLNRLWIIRHSVAHNAGFITGPDAARFGASDIAEKVVNTESDFLSKTHNFLGPIAERLAVRCGKCILARWIRLTAELGPDFERDEAIYKRLKWLGTYINSRPTKLPEFTERDYLSDFNKLVN